MFSFPLIYCHTTPSSIPENQERLKVIKQESPAPERWTPATRLSCLISLGISSFHLTLAHKLLLIIALVWNKDTALWCLPQLNCKSNRANMKYAWLLSIADTKLFRSITVCNILCCSSGNILPYSMGLYSYFNVCAIKLGLLFFRSCHL